MCGGWACCCLERGWSVLEAAAVTSCSPAKLPCRLTNPPVPLCSPLPPAAGVDRRSMLEIECAAKIGLSGGPLYYRCACVSSLRLLQ